MGVVCHAKRCEKQSSVGSGMNWSVRVVSQVQSSGLVVISSAAISPPAGPTAAAAAAAPVAASAAAAAAWWPRRPAQSSPAAQRSRAACRGVGVGRAVGGRACRAPEGRLSPPTQTMHSLERFSSLHMLTLHNHPPLPTHRCMRPGSTWNGRRRKSWRGSRPRASCSFSAAALMARYCAGRYRSVAHRCRSCNARCSQGVSGRLQGKRRARRHAACGAARQVPHAAGLGPARSGNAGQ